MVKYKIDVFGGETVGKIKMIATDLDGTFLTDDKRISEANIKAVQDAVKSGIVFVPATGRGLYTMPENVLKLDGIRYIITSNGASVIDRRAEEVIYKKQISGEMAAEIVGHGLDIGIMAEVFVGGRAYTLKRFAEDFISHGVNPRFVQWMFDTRILIDKFDDVLKKDTEVENINLIFTDNGLRRETYDFILNNFDTEITNSIGNNLEVGAKDCSKGEALEFLADMLKINMSDVMSLGDNSNDRDMIERAGVGVAVKNADENIKRSADCVVSSNNDSGFAEAVYRFALERQ